jgi:hypothetical protein
MLLHFLFKILKCKGIENIKKKSFQIKINIFFATKFLFIFLNKNYLVFLQSEIFDLYSYKFFIKN